ncbi:MAG TPA: MarR family transcriptional regulator [Polyangiaceae bacterium]|jgi:DNA-binding MarR family transcriptional regulator|nr:MarR family transcriptional regulator [Polyangiaceae bacterium]
MDDPASFDLPTLAWLAGHSANEFVLAELKRSGHGEVRISHGYVIQCLLGGSRTVGELARDLEVTQQAASKVVVELEALGYLVRKSDPADSRIRRVELTSNGQRLVKQARAARARLEARALAALGPSAAAAARRVLLALLEASGGREAARSRRVRPPRE